VDSFHPIHYLLPVLGQRKWREPHRLRPGSSPCRARWSDPSARGCDLGRCSLPSRRGNSCLGGRRTIRSPNPRSRVPATETP